MNRGGFFDWTTGALVAVAILGAFVATAMLALVAGIAVDIYQRGDCIEHSQWRLGGDATFVAGTYCSRWRGERR